MPDSPSDDDRPRWRWITRSTADAEENAMHPVITEMIVKARQDDLDRAYRHPRGERTGGRRRAGRRRAERRY